jgi:hypothetical protein
MNDTWHGIMMFTAARTAAVLIGLFAFSVHLAHAESTTQRDAPTTRFYDSRGNVTGSASTYGNTTRFYDSRSRSLGTATHNNGR